MLHAVVTAYFCRRILVLQGVPQVHGSKFVFGVVLDGAVAKGANDTVKGDSDMDDGVFVLVGHPNNVCTHC